jgi:histidinol-phosphate aminotransferase
MKGNLSPLHGGPDALGVPPHDFSTNANACGPCPAALLAVREADAAHYPDPGYTRLSDALAAFHGVNVNRVVLAASGSEFIFRITAWAAQQGMRTVALPRHAYGDYARAAQAWGLQTVVGSQDAPLLWRCDPGNPLGDSDTGAWPMPDAGQLLVLDRAYSPLRLQGQCGYSAQHLDRYWQLWTPNKALGLTGVRGAYAIAPLGADDAVQTVAQLAPSWPLGAHAAALLHAWAWPQVQDWLCASLETLRTWKPRQQTMLAELGWTCLPSDANFFCARPYADADTAQQRLAANLQVLRANGIKLRDCASFGLPGHVRVSVQAPVAQDALAAAWRALTTSGETA